MGYGSSKESTSNDWPTKIQKSCDSVALPQAYNSSTERLILTAVPLSHNDRSCHELSQSRYESRIKWATTCTIGSYKYKNLKLKKRERKGRKQAARGRSYIAPYGSRVAYEPAVSDKITISDEAYIFHLLYITLMHLGLRMLPLKYRLPATSFISQSSIDITNYVSTSWQ
jgi:hypothetical protein